MDSPDSPSFACHQHHILIRLAQGNGASANAARAELVELYEPLVMATVNRLVFVPALHRDMRQAGYVGLLEAIRRFDLNRGTHFPGFAKRWVEGEIKSSLRAYGNWTPGKLAHDDWSEFDDAFVDETQPDPDLFEVRDAVRVLINSLPEQKQRLAIGVFVEERTLASFAAEYEVSRPAITKQVNGIRETGRRQLAWLASSLSAA